MRVAFVSHVPGSEVDAAIAAWRAVRPDDVVTSVPWSTGGTGLLDLVARPDDRVVPVEVAGPHGHPVEAAVRLRTDGTAVVEAAPTGGGDAVPGGTVAWAHATSYGVGQLLDAARSAGARRLVVGTADVPAVDGGAGAVTALGYRVTVADGSGLKIGGEDLARVAAVDRGWSADWSDVDVVVLTDTDASLLDAAAHAGPDASRVGAALEAWADVAERDLPGDVHRDVVGTAGGGGLAFGLAAALPGATLAPAAPEIARLAGPGTWLDEAELVVVPGPVGGDLARQVASAVAARVVTVTEGDEAAVVAAARRTASSA